MPLVCNSNGRMSNGSHSTKVVLNVLHDIVENMHNSQRKLFVLYKLPTSLYKRKKVSKRIRQVRKLLSSFSFLCSWKETIYVRYIRLKKRGKSIICHLNRVATATL